MSNNDWKSETPSKWAKEKQDTGVKRFDDPELGPEFIRQCGIIFPSVPPELLMGFALNAGVRENTTGFITGLADERPPKKAKPPLGGVATQSFHELGMFGVEGGPRERACTRQRFSMEHRRRFKGCSIPARSGW